MTGIPDPIPCAIGSPKEQEKETKEGSKKA
jgi:hypothetical protein